MVNLWSTNVILNKNPFDLNKDEIKQIKVVETIIRGTSVYKRSYLINKIKMLIETSIYYQLFGS